MLNLKNFPNYCKFPGFQLPLLRMLYWVHTLLNRCEAIMSPPYSISISSEVAIWLLCQMKHYTKKLKNCTNITSKLICFLPFALFIRALYILAAKCIIILFQKIPRKEYYFLNLKQHVHQQLTVLNI